jgi:hypothetical protein
LLLPDFLQQFFPGIVGEFLAGCFNLFAVHVGWLSAVIGKTAGCLADRGLFRPIIQTGADLFACHIGSPFSGNSSASVLCQFGE